MSLEQKFQNYTTLELIAVSEPHCDYTHEAKTIVIEILKEKSNINDSEVIEAAKSYWKTYLQENIKTILTTKKIPKSYFLNEDEIKVLISLAFEHWKEQQALFGIDITKYWAVPF